MPYRLFVETVEGTIEQIVFADSKRQALKKAAELVIGVRILRKSVKEVF